MVSIHFLDLMRGMMGIRHLLLALPLAIATMAGSPATADDAASVDRSLLAIEQVDLRLSRLGESVGHVVKAAVADGNTEAAEAQSILAAAVSSSFEKGAMTAEILKGMGEGSGSAADAAALAKAASAFEAGRAKIVRMYETRDQVLGKEIDARLDQADGARIRQLAEQMASPELGVEGAVTAQVMYGALEAFADGNAADIATVSTQDMKAQLGGVVKTIRDKTQNEKPLPKDIARMDEVARLTFILATLPAEDLAVIAGFYGSPAGKARREALVASYRQASDVANGRMLESYFAGLADHFKTHPRPQP